MWAMIPILRVLLSGMVLAIFSIPFSSAAGCTDCAHKGAAQYEFQGRSSREYLARYEFFERMGQRENRKKIPPGGGPGGTVMVPKGVCGVVPYVSTAAAASRSAGTAAHAERVAAENTVESANNNVNEIVGNAAQQGHDVAEGLEQGTQVPQAQTAAAWIAAWIAARIATWITLAAVFNVAGYCGPGAPVIGRRRVSLQRTKGQNTQHNQTNKPFLHCSSLLALPESLPKYLPVTSTSDLL
jgi:hypothetical protein